MGVYVNHKGDIYYVDAIPASSTNRSRWFFRVIVQDNKVLHSATEAKRTEKSAIKAGQAWLNAYLSF